MLYYTNIHVHPTTETKAECAVRPAALKSTNHDSPAKEILCKLSTNNKVEKKSARVYQHPAPQ